MMTEMLCCVAPQAWSTGAATARPRSVARGATRWRSVERSDTRRGITFCAGQLLVRGWQAGAASCAAAARPYVGVRP